MRCISYDPGPWRSKRVAVITLIPMPTQRRAKANQRRAARRKRVVFHALKAIAYDTNSGILPRRENSMDVASNDIEGLKLIGGHCLLSVDRVIIFERFFYLGNALQADHSTLLHVSLSEPRHKSGTIRLRYEVICFAVCSVVLRVLLQRYRPLHASCTKASHVHRHVLFLSNF